MNYHLSVAARTLWGEARGEQPATQLAVAWVIVNRLKSGRWGHTLALVCRAPWQFSCWNEHDPNRAVLEGLNDEDYQLLGLAATIAHVLASSDPLDPTRGAKWYKNTTLPWPHDWGTVRKPTLVSGALSFYNLDVPAPSVKDA